MKLYKKSFKGIALAAFPYWHCLPAPTGQIQKASIWQNPESTNSLPNCMPSI